MIRPRRHGRFVDSGLAVDIPGFCTEWELFRLHAATGELNECFRVSIEGNGGSSLGRSGIPHKQPLWGRNVALCIHAA